MIRRLFDCIPLRTALHVLASAAKADVIWQGDAFFGIVPNILSGDFLMDNARFRWSPYPTVSGWSALDFVAHKGC
jgi:hypothetical protein